MLGDGLRDVRVDALGVRVVAAHLPLELGELEDDQRLEIRFGEARGVTHLLGIHVDLRGQRPGRHGARELLDTPHLVADGPQLALEDHRIELRQAALERLLAVFGDEETRVREARAEDAVVALRDHVAGVRGVHHVEVARQERALGVSHREVALMIAHHRDHHRLGEREEVLVEAAGHDEGLLDQRRALVEQELVVHQLAADLVRRELERVLHLAATLGGVDEDVRASERVDVSACALDGERVRRQEAMPAALVACGDVGERERHHLVAEQRHEPVDRAAEGVLARAPTHLLGERDARADLGQELAQELGRRLALLGDVRGDVVALVGGELLQLRDLDPVLLGEALGRARRRAIPKRRAPGRAGHGLASIFLPIGQTSRDEPETPWSAEDGQRGGLEARANEGVLGRRRQRLQPGRDERRGELFDADLEQVVGHAGWYHPARAHSTARSNAPRIPGRA